MKIPKNTSLYFVAFLGIASAFLVFFMFSLIFHNLAIKRYEKQVLDYTQTVGQIIGKNTHTIKIIEIFSREKTSSNTQKNYEIFGEIITDDNETIKGVAAAVNNNDELIIKWHTKDFLTYLPKQNFDLIKNTAAQALLEQKPVMSKPFRKTYDNSNLMIFVYPFAETNNDQRFIAGIFEIDGLLKAVLNRHDTPAGLDISIKDITDKNKPIILGYHKSRINLNSSSKKLWNDIFTANLEIGLRNWQFEFRPVTSLVSPFENIISLFSAMTVLAAFWFLIKYLRIVQIQRLQNARLANLGEASAGLAHEINQPLNIIRLKAENILMSKDEASLEITRKTLKTIADQTERIGKIIDHVRVFARQEKEEEDLFLVNDAIGNALKMFKQLCQNINVEAKISNIQTYTKGQQIKLEQVIINILLNARDAINEKYSKDSKEGQITINLSLKQKDFLEIEIKNNGTSISKRNIKKLFNSFFTTKKANNGTGLGLAICNTIISSMNGTITVAKLENGTSFIIKLPSFFDKSFVKKGVFEEEPIEPEKPHILIVDDETDALETMSESLRKEGFRISSASNIESAVTIFEEDPSDLLITDIKIGKESGFTLIDTLKSYNSSLPIIIVSGHLDFHKIEKTHKDLLENYVIVMNKPISLQELITKVKDVWEKQY